jgi:general secretion pathway protein D
MTSGKQFLLFVLISVFVASCGAPTGKRNDLLANREEGERGGRERGASPFEALLMGRGGDTRSLGTDDFIGNGVPVELVQADGQGDFTLNLLNVPIEQAAKAVLGDALQKNYTVQPGVSGSVTLQTTRPLAAAELLDTFQTILELNGLTMQISDSLISIVPLSGATRRITLGNTGGPGSRIVAVPLRYVGTAEMVRLVQPISGEGLSMQAIANRNILLLGGSKDEINAAIEAINLFDVDVMEGKSVALIKLKAAEPEAVVAELNTIFESQEGGSLQNVVTFVPSTRLGAVLVVSSRAKYLTEAERWIRDLDRAAGGTKRRPVVYSLQNRSAATLAPILQEMLTSVAEGDVGAAEGSPRVVADDAKNAVIVWGNDTEQDNFSRIIQSLDTAPVQVLLEATIAEVSLNDELNFGLRWFFERNGIDGTFTDASNGSTGQSFPGLSILFQGSNAAATLSALNSVTDVNVVSSPSLMVLDNQEARLQIGDQVPIATQEVKDTSDPNAPIVSTISLRDTGIILSVRPRVSASGQVVLEIEQEVSSVANTTSSGIDSPTISQRKVKTSVVALDGQTIALGGLIEDRHNQTNTKVPGAGDVPIVGGLFRSRKDKFTRTELLILITPRVIHDGNDARTATEELRRRIMAADGVIEEGILVPSTGHRIID